MGNTQPYNAQPYSRDRTQEFQSIVETLKNSSSSSSSSPLPLQFEFDKRVSKISLGIRQTSQKLAKLAKVSKRRSVFDDPTREIQVLSEVIKQDITALNSDVLDLQRLCNTQNGSWNVSADASKHYTEVIANLKNRLRNLTRDFIDLTMRTEMLKADETRRQLYCAHASTEFTNPSVRLRQPPWVNCASSSSTQFPRKQADVESEPLLQQMVQRQDTYTQSRAKALKNIESTTREISIMCNQLAAIVSRREKKSIRSIRIDEIMEDNVDGAQNELVRYLNSISPNGWLTIKIFFVLIVFLMIFLIFVK